MPEFEVKRSGNSLVWNLIKDKVGINYKVALLKYLFCTLNIKRNIQHSCFPIWLKASKLAFGIQLNIILIGHDMFSKDQFKVLSSAEVVLLTYFLGYDVHVAKSGCALYNY